MWHIKFISLVYCDTCCTVDDVWLRLNESFFFFFFFLLSLSKSLCRLCWSSDGKVSEKHQCTQAFKNTCICTHQATKQFTQKYIHLQTGTFNGLKTIALIVSSFTLPSPQCCRMPDLAAGDRAEKESVGIAP